MSFSEIGPSGDQGHSDNIDREKRERDYLNIRNKLSHEFRDMLGLFESSLMESDIYDRYKNSNKKRKRLAWELRGMGIDEKGVETVFNYFNLPMPQKAHHGERK